MSLTLRDVRRTLDVPEVDYRAAAALGEEALPYLEHLACGADTVLVSKAVYLASVIGGTDGARIVRDAAAHPDPIVRVAAKSAMRNLPA